MFLPHWGAKAVGQHGGVSDEFFGGCGVVLSGGVVPPGLGVDPCCGLQVGVLVVEPRGHARNGRHRLAILVCGVGSELGTHLLQCGLKVGFEVQPGEVAWWCRPRCSWWFVGVLAVALCGWELLVDVACELGDGVECS